MRKLAIKCILIGGVIVGTICAIWYRSDKPTTKGVPSQPSGQTAVETSPPSLIGPVVVHGNATIDDMVGKGLPIPSNPRRYVLDSTKNQTLEDCIRDMGNRFTVSIGCPVEVGGDTSSLSSWRKLTYHVKALRAIEEGSTNPVRVRGLIMDELHRSMRDSLSELFVKGLKDKSPHEISEYDPYYLEHREYEDTRAEYSRRMDSIVQCFFVLANIGELSSAQKELATFAQTPFPAEKQKPKDGCVFFMACCLRELEKKGLPLDRELLAEVKDVEIPMRSRSSWNAVVDIHDQFVRMVNLDVSGIKTIRVIDFPASLPKSLRLDDVIAKFSRMSNR